MSKACLTQAFPSHEANGRTAAAKPNPFCQIGGRGLPMRPLVTGCVCECRSGCCERGMPAWSAFAMAPVAIRSTDPLTSSPRSRPIHPAGWQRRCSYGAYGVLPRFRPRHSFYRRRAAASSKGLRSAWKPLVAAAALMCKSMTRTSACSAGPGPMDSWDCVISNVEHKRGDGPLGPRFRRSSELSHEPWKKHRRRRRADIPPMTSHWPFETRMQGSGTGRQAPPWTLGTVPNANLGRIIQR